MALVQVISSKPTSNSELQIETEALPRDLGFSTDITDARHNVKSEGALGEESSLQVHLTVAASRSAATVNETQTNPDPLVGLPTLPFTYPPSLSERVGVHEEPNPRLVKLQNRRANAHFAALCFSFFMGGWNDAATVDFVVVSLLFIASSVGAMLGGVITMRLADKLGMGKIYFLGASVLVIGYSIQASAPPFPLLAIAFGIDGLGWSIQIALGNSHVNSTKNAASRFGVLHACYGVAALTVPLVSTQFACTHRWSFHYLTSLSLAVINTIVIGSVFRFRRQEELLELSGDSIVTTEGTVNHSNKFKRMLQFREVHFLAFWTFIYVGVEVTTGGWINTFLIDLRGAGASQGGYVVTGFWGGLTVGRVAFLWVNRKVGEKRVIFFYTLFAIGMQLTVWLIPSLFENAVAVAFVGLFLGPMYPIAMRQAGKVLPRVLLSGCIGWISGLGQAGSAFLPFLTGALANKFGIGSLQPFIVSMMAAMLGSWALVPNAPRRTD